MSQPNPQFVEYGLVAEFIDNVRTGESQVRYFRPAEQTAAAQAVVRSRSEKSARSKPPKRRSKAKRRNR